MQSPIALCFVRRALGLQVERNINTYSDSLFSKGRSTISTGKKKSFSCKFCFLSSAFYVSDLILIGFEANRTRLSCQSSEILQACNDGDFVYQSCEVHHALPFPSILWRNLVKWQNIVQVCDENNQNFRTNRLCLRDRCLPAVKTFIKVKKGA